VKAISGQQHEKLENRDEKDTEDYTGTFSA